jgi:hypothetical protein
MVRQRTDQREHEQHNELESRRPQAIHAGGSTVHSATLEPARGSESNHGFQDFSTIDAHLKKAHQSNEKATRFFTSGRVREALVQSQLTRIFIHNALARINQQCENRDASSPIHLPY